jgi:hypothetical protein
MRKMQARSYPDLVQMMLAVRRSDGAQSTE